MSLLMIVVFVIGYAAIALEHPIKVNKSASALLLAVLMWLIYAMGGSDVSHFPDALREHLGEISEILFFLLGAMTIVELVDSHDGFRIITDKIRTTNKAKLLWVISFITFFLSAVLDNLTTAIVMTALLRKLVTDQKERWFYAGMVIIAANSGGAFSPIGDVTTIMLWIGGYVTSFNIIIKTFIASLLSMVVPLALLSLTLKGDIKVKEDNKIDSSKSRSTTLERNTVFILGIGSLLFIPVFKSITHLPPYLGILLGLGVLWVVTERMHRKRPDEYRSRRTVAGVLQRVDTPSILFFLGILLAVAALQSAGILVQFGKILDQKIGNLYVINGVIGLLSSIVDNVPLVAGAMGMYDMVYPTDHYFWEMLAYCAGTGGSILIIGSAAGVAVMGMEKIDFIWYLKKISGWALIGYLAGAVAFWLQSLL